MFGVSHSTVCVCVCVCLGCHTTVCVCVYVWDVTHNCVCVCTCVSQLHIHVDMDNYMVPYTHVEDTRGYSGQLYTDV